jgi:hypothetical protein
MKKAKDLSVKHEGMESMADEAKETRLEKKGYVETSSGKMKKVKKAYTGRAVRQPTETDTEFEIRHEYHTPFKGPQKASLGALIGIGADNLLKKSETARSLTKNLGIGGNLLGSYYDKKADTRDKTTGSEQTKQITAKRMGGMAIPDYADGGEVVFGKGKDYIKDLL